jgi:hypothetical protein
LEYRTRLFHRSCTGDMYYRFRSWLHCCRCMDTILIRQDKAEGRKRLGWLVFTWCESSPLKIHASLRCTSPHTYFTMEQALKLDSDAMLYNDPFASTLVSLAIVIVIVLLHPHPLSCHFTSFPPPAPTAAIRMKSNHTEASHDPYHPLGTTPPISQPKLTQPLIATPLFPSSVLRPPLWRHQPLIPAHPQPLAKLISTPSQHHNM